MNVHTLLPDPAGSNTTQLQAVEARCPSSVPLASAPPPSHGEKLEAREGLTIPTDDDDDGDDDDVDHDSDSDDAFLPNA